MNLQDIIPFSGLGDLRFGVSRATVHALLGNNFKSFRKSPYSTNDTDAYDELGFHLYYDNDDQLEYIETYPPCNPMYDGVSLFGKDTKALLQELSEMGYYPVDDDEGYNFEQLGFGLYIPDEKIEAVSIYRKGY